MKVTQSCLTLCNPLDYTIHGILQARVLEWAAFPFSRGSSQSPGIEPRSPALQDDSLPAESQGKPTSLPGLHQKETGRSPVLGLRITRSPNKNLHLDLAFDMKAPQLHHVSGPAPHEEPSCSSANTLGAHVALCAIQTP